jgi:ubiquinone/menaquinone biosynthesis C-methylase UbiE
VYDRLAEHYDGAMRPLDRWFLTRLRSKTLSRIPANSRVLEIGAGTGLNFPFYPLGARGVASELSHPMIVRAKQKARPPGVCFVQNSAEELPFVASSFDAAFATLVFCSVASPQAALAELRRVVKTGGLVVLLDHVRPGGLLGPLFDLLSIVTVALFEDHFNRRIADEATRAGLHLLGTERRAFGMIQLTVCQV